MQQEFNYKNENRISILAQQIIGIVDSKRAKVSLSGSSITYSSGATKNLKIPVGFFRKETSSPTIKR